MKDFIVRAALIIGLPALTWLGFINGVEGAVYVVKFFVWVICLPGGLIAITETMQKKMAATPPSSRPMRAVSRLIAWAVLGVMVWTGHIATACAWAIYMLCAAICAEGAKKLRAAQATA